MVTYLWFIFIPVTIVQTSAYLKFIIFYQTDFLLILSPHKKEHAKCDEMYIHLFPKNLKKSNKYNFHTFPHNFLCIQYEFFSTSNKIFPQETRGTQKMPQNTFSFWKLFLCQYFYTALHSQDSNTVWKMTSSCIEHVGVESFWFQIIAFLQHHLATFTFAY